VNVLASKSEAGHAGGFRQIPQNIKIPGFSSSFLSEWTSKLAALSQILQTKHHWELSGIRSWRVVTHDRLARVRRLFRSRSGHVCCDSTTADPRLIRVHSPEVFFFIVGRIIESYQFLAMQRDTISSPNQSDRSNPRDSSDPAGPMIPGDEILTDRVLCLF
jgi:hypothetical protein